MPPTCPEANTLQGLLEGTLPETVQTELSQHLEGCARCRAALDKLATDGKSFSDLARNLQESPKPEPGLQRVLDQAVSETDPDATLGALPADVKHELPFLAPSTKPGHLGRLGHYEILSVIGKGGFGIVLKAFDEKLHRMVAIKVLSPAYAAIASARKRFIREARAAAAVKNEHVVGIYDVQDEAQPPFLVMELIDGISLQDKLDKHGALGVKEILRIGVQMAEGLTAAHKQGLVHRDIKPANILLENGVERVKITDFGLARAVDDASMTQSGTVAGTPMYMSPEQAEGLPIDHRSDLFSLGTVLYAMCTGHPPFRATGTHAVLKRVIDAAPRPIREINPEMPDWLEAVIAKLHAKRPEDRFQTAKEVAELLGQHLAHVQQPGTAPKPPGVQRLPAREPPAWTHQPSRAHRLISFVTMFAAFAGSIFAFLTVLNALFTIPGPANARIGIGLLALSALAVFWRYRRIRLTHPWTGLSYALAGALGATAVAGLGLHLYFGPRTPFQETIALQVKGLAPDGSDWVPLFNGKNLDGWHEVGARGTWVADNGNLRAFGRAGYLVSDRSYVDFHLKAELRISPGTEFGLLFRTDQVAANANVATAQGQGVEFTYQGPTLDVEGRIHMGMRFTGDIPPAGAGTNLKPHAWLPFDVIVQGDSVKVDIAGAMIGAGVAKAFKAGPIILRLAKDNSVLELRNIQIKNLSPTAPPLPAEQWVQLFNGKNLVGWKPHPEQPNTWRVQQGVLIGTGPTSPLFSDHLTGKPFHLRAEVRINDGGQGAVLAHVPDTTLWGWSSAAINSTAKSYKTGSLYCTYANWVKGVADQKAPPKADDWFTLDFISRPSPTAAGSRRVVVRVNGEITAEVEAEDWIRAYQQIALQVAGEKSMIQFRKIEIKELPSEEPAFVQLFNGKDLSGWIVPPPGAGKGAWHVDKLGNLVGRGPSNYLFTERDDFADFHLRAEVSAVGGTDSGIFFRCGLNLPHGKFPAGYEANIGFNQPYETGTLIRTTPDRDLGEILFQVPQAPAPAATFFTMEIIARGNRLVVKIDDKKVAEYTDENATYLKGRIALQAYSQQALVHFKKIEIKKLPSDSLTVDLVRFQGLWIIESAEALGKALPAENVQGSVEFQGNKLRMTMPGGATDDASFTLDATKDPKQIDVFGGKNPKRELGIYRFDGDRLVLCIGDDKERPAEFKSQAGTSRQVFVFKRAAPAKWLIAGWGEFVNRDGASDLREEKGGVTFLVPAGDRTFYSPQAATVVPRLVREVEGDFTAQVKILAPAPPPAGEKNCLRSACLAVWNDDADLHALMFSPSTTGNDGIITMRFRNGPLGGWAGSMTHSKAFVLLKIERHGDRLTTSWSADGVNWQKPKDPVIVDWPKKLKVGVAVNNRSSEEWRVQFENLEIKELNKAEVTPPAVPQQAADVLKFFVGSWKMEAVIDEPKLPNGLEAHGSGVQTFELVAGGKFLRGYDTETKGKFETLAVQTWDPEEQTFQGWLFVSNADMMGPAVGTWDAAKRVLTWKETFDNGTRMTQVVEFVSSTTVKMHLIHRNQDKILYEMHQTMTRLEKPADVKRIPTDPKLPAEMKVLDRITGDWRNHVTVKTADKPKEPKAMTALLLARPVLGGRMIECRETNEVNGEQTYWLTTYDARLKKYRFWHFHSSGNTANFDGSWDEAKKTVFWKAADKTIEGRWIFRNDDERDIAHSAKDVNGNLVYEVVGVCKRIKPKPFVLRSKDQAAEQFFDTLKEAIAKAESGDTIEIHGNGPFVSNLVRIKKALRIQAAKGYRPVITFKHEPLDKFWLAMMDVQAPLIVEGIEFRYAKPDKGGVVQVFLVTSDLRMTHCRVTAQGDANAIMLNYGSAELSRCEILTDLWGAIRWNFDGAAKLVVNESLVAGPEALMMHAYAVRDKVHDLDVRIHRSTLVGSEKMIAWLVDHVQPAPKAARKPIRVHTSENVFSLSHDEPRMVCVYCNVDGEYQEAAQAKVLLEQAMSWSEERNLYPHQSLIGLADWKAGKLLPGGYLCANLDEWCKFWGIPPTKSTQGSARFQGGDILAKLQTNIHAVTPADFRLAQGSPGQGVLPAGMDLGANVALIGPGEAYERWKKTAAYQEWRQQTDALMNTAAKAQN